MTDIYVTHPNPVNFLKDLAERFKDGYYADDTVAGAPHLQIINEIRLTKSDKPDNRHDYSSVKELHITSWNDTDFILNYQDAVLQGFELVDDSLQIAGPVTPHFVSMKRPQAKVLQASVSDVKEEAVVVPTPEAEEGPEELTEASDDVSDKPARRKAGRPAKIKEL